MNTRAPLWILLFLLIGNVSSALVVLIDPGHGGENLGAITKLNEREVFEKNLTLKLSFLLKKELDKENIIAYMTRLSDQNLELAQRSLMASDLKADLFISIHFNSSENKEHKGFEVFYLDNSSNDTYKKIEEKENSGHSFENTLVQNILIDLIVKKTAKLSKKLALDLDTEFKKFVEKKYSVKSRGVKPGLFYVLAMAKRPGILIEAGFMSNPKELKMISSEKYLKTLAKSIAKAIVKNSL